MDYRLSGVLASVILGVAITLGGWFVGAGFRDSRTGDRYVTVKGLAEREVKADRVLWPFRFVATNDDLAQAQGKISADAAQVQAFLERAGIALDQVEVQTLRVTDQLAQPYRSGPVQSRFIVEQTLLVRSEEVDRIAAASQQIGTLVEAGVVLSSDGQAGGPVYLFTRLNDIKPEMIAEATRNARESAQQFARDSESRVAAIRRANQGIFQILPRDQAPGLFEPSQIHKRVRVVSTIEFGLAD